MYHGYTVTRWLCISTQLFLSLLGNTLTFSFSPLLSFLPPLHFILYRSSMETLSPSSDGKYVLGLSVGQEVRCCRHLDVGGRVVVRCGTKGHIAGTAHHGRRVAVRFANLRTNLNVFRADIQPTASWKVGLHVEATRNLHSSSLAAKDCQALVFHGSIGTVQGLATDTSKLSVKFVECPFPINVVPYDDVEPAWRAESRRRLEKEETIARREVLAERNAEWETLQQLCDEENEREAFQLEAHLLVVVADVRDEHTAPQSLTGWVREAPIQHHASARHLRDAPAPQLLKVLSRIEKRILLKEGQSEHQLFYALRLFLGIGAVQDYAECEAWLVKSAKGKNERALNMLGILRLADRNGVPKDAKVAMDHFTVAASLGCVSSAYNIGAVLTGYTHTLPTVTVPSNLSMALRRFRFAASKGHASAMYRLGLLLMDSAEEEAIAFLESAATAGHAKAQHRLGIHYVNTDFGKSMEHFKVASEQGHADAQHRYGISIFSGPIGMTDLPVSPTSSSSSGYSESKYFTNMAIVDTSISREDSWPFWQGDLPDRLRSYEGAFQTDKAEGVAWLREAAAGGHLQAMNSLGLCLLHGETMVPQNIRGGVAWLRHASTNGCVAAMHNLACCMFTGEGTPVDTRGALELWRKADRSGSAEANKKLKNLAEWVFQGEEKAMQLLGERNQNAECELVLKVIAEKGLADAGRGAIMNAIKATLQQGEEEEMGPVSTKEDGTPRRVVRLVMPATEDTEAVPELLCKVDATEVANGWRAPESSFGVIHIIPRPFTGGVRGEVAGGVVGQLLEAQFALGLQYLFGTFIEEDHQAAAQLFWRVADSSVVPHSGAQNVLGVCFEHGLGVPKHVKMAVHWYRKAASRGLPVAMHNLASCLFVGDGVRQNRKEAVRWWKRAGEMNYSHALFRLALCELCGEGCKHNKASGLKNLQLASELGITQAKVLEKSIRHSVTGSDSSDSDGAYDATLPANHKYVQLITADTTSHPSSTHAPPLSLP